MDDHFQYLGIPKVSFPATQKDPKCSRCGQKGDPEKTRLKKWKKDVIDEDLEQFDLDMVDYDPDKDCEITLSE